MNIQSDLGYILGVQVRPPSRASSLQDVIPCKGPGCEMCKREMDGQ